MIRTLSRPIPLVLALAFFTFIPVMLAAVRVVQIPLGALTDDDLRLASVPVAFFFHSLAGVLFGVLGPLQFVRALRLRFGTLHRLTGRVFVLAGAGLALSGLALLLQVQSIATGLLDAARGVFGLALIAALVLGVAAARAHDMLRHRAWMIRAYAIGMGSGTIAPVMFPIYLIAGEPVMGLATDIVVVGMWLLTIALGEWVVRRLASPDHYSPSSPCPNQYSVWGKPMKIDKADSHRGATMTEMRSADPSGVAVDLNQDLARFPARTGQRVRARRRRQRARLHSEGHG